jgi:hypothetical protein
MQVVFTKYPEQDAVLLFQIIHEMRKEKNTSNSSEKQTPIMRVVETTNDNTRLEFEIERHVRSIRALIKRLRPLDRQRYYAGLLSHLLSQPVEYPFTKAESKQHDSDYSHLSAHELSLIREFSIKIEELYRHSDHGMNN